MRRDFVGADVFATFALPWSWYSESGWGVGTRLMTSAGAFSGMQKTAFVTSVVPLIALGARDGAVTGPALIIIGEVAARADGVELEALVATAQRAA